MNDRESPSSKQLYADFQRNLITEGVIELIEQHSLASPPELRSVSDGIPRISITKIVEHTGVPRASFYRLFPEGFTSVIQELSRDTLIKVQTTVERNLSALANSGKDLTVQDVIHVGSSGLFEGFSMSAYVQRVLVPQGELLPEFARTKLPLRPLPALGRFATKLAASSMDDEYNLE